MEASNGVFTPSVARESGCQAEAGSTRPGAVESVAACTPGPAAAVHSAQGERRCEPLRPLLAPGDGRPHRPAEHGPSDARQLCAAVCSSVLGATAATKPSRPERWRARVVAIALVAAVALAALATLGSVLGARPAPPRPPPPEGFTPSSLEGSSHLGSSHPPGVAAVRGGAGAPHAATGHSGAHSAHKRAGGGGASSPPPPTTTATATIAAAAATTTTSSPLPQEARHGSSSSSSSNATTRHGSGKVSGHEAAHEAARAPGPVRGPASGSGAAPGQPVQREPHGEAKVAGAHAPRHKQEHDKQ